MKMVKAMQITSFILRHAVNTLLTVFFLLSSAHVATAQEEERDYTLRPPWYLFEPVQLEDVLDDNLLQLVEDRGYKPSNTIYWILFYEKGGRVYESDLPHVLGPNGIPAEDNPGMQEVLAHLCKLPREKRVVVSWQTDTRIEFRFPQDYNLSRTKPCAYADLLIKDISKQPEGEWNYETTRLPSYFGEVSTDEKWFQLKITMDNNEIYKISVETWRPVKGFFESFWHGLSMPRHTDRKSIGFRVYYFNDMMGAK